MIRVVLGVLVIGLCVSNAQGGTRKERKQRHSQSERQQSASPLASSAPKEAASAVTRYMTEELNIEDVAEFSLTMQMRERIAKIPEDSRRRIAELISEQSAKTLGAIFRAFGRTAYNNVIALGPAGVGKTFLTDQLTLLFSMGIVPDFLKPELGIVEGDDERFKVMREAFLGKTEVVLVNLKLLSQDPTKPGRAYSKDETRMRIVLSDLFKAAAAEYKTTGHRTVFVFDEVATLPDMIQQALKSILDKGGFRNPADPVRGPTDLGFSVLAMTTPDEYRVMVQGDSAVDRRYSKVILSEPSEEQAFKIVRRQTDIEWNPLYGVNVSDEAIRFVIRMRRYLDTPPLAMPASVLKGTNDLMLSLESMNGRDAIDLKSAQQFVMKRVGLTDIWFEGPKGEPPFHDFAERVKARVIGQDEVVEKIADRLKAWARLGFGGEVPVFFLGGPSGSGKDTLLKAINEVMFGHDGNHLMFSIGGIGGFGIESIIEGPPRGNHRDDKGARLAEALDNGPSTGLVVFNEGKDAPTEQLEKLKVFIELGEIRSKGVDSRSRPVMFPIFILGQWGEELFDERFDANIAQIKNDIIDGKADYDRLDRYLQQKYKALSQADLEKYFTAGKDSSGVVGAVSRALLDRSKKTGGVFLLSPVQRALYPLIVEIHVRKMAKQLKTNANIDLQVSRALIEAIARTSIEAGEGTRGLGATTVDFTESVISKAMDRGLALRDVAVSIDYERGNKDLLVVKAGDKIWKFEADIVRRIKIASCEAKLR